MKSTNFIFMSMLFVAALSMTSCDDDDCITGMGSTVTRELDLDDFHSISTSGEYGITIEQASEQKVEVTSQNNIIDELRLDVIDGTWLIEPRDKKCYKDIDITIRIYIPEIREIETSGAIDLVINSFEDLNNLDINCSGEANIFQSGVLNIDNGFSLNVSGSTDAIFNMNTQSVEIDISGAGTIKLTGTTDSQEFNVSGSGTFNSFDMETGTCEIDISGQADMDVNVQDLLDVTISGSGTVRYIGNPTVESNISGLGEIIDAN